MGLTRDGRVVLSAEENGWLPGRVLVLLMGGPQVLGAAVVSKVFPGPHDILIELGGVVEELCDQHGTTLFIFDQMSWVAPGDMFTLRLDRVR